MSEISLLLSIFVFNFAVVYLPHTTILPHVCSFSRIKKCSSYFTGTKRLKSVQHDNAPVNKASSMKTYGLPRLEWKNVSGQQRNPDLLARHQYPTSYALVAE